MIPSLSMYYTCYNRNAFVISSMIFGPATSLFTSPDHDTMVMHGQAPRPWTDSEDGGVGVLWRCHWRWQIWAWGENPCN